ncbi:hypothetical protein ACT3TQ_09970 [Halomonas sp. AOP12-C2-37]|uniref:hypothetical protein n=1 Tax=unclassified Halomonas TaxID=2609666 RepID=UPI0040339E3E
MMLGKNKTVFNKQGEFTQDEATLAGSIEEIALSAHDVVEINQDWTDEEPCFLEDDGMFLEPPTSITRARAEKASDG